VTVLDAGAARIAAVSVRRAALCALPPSPHRMVNLTREWQAVRGIPSAGVRGGAVWAGLPERICCESPGGEIMAVMLDRLMLPELPVLRGERVILRGHRESDVDDRLRYPIDPEEEDCYGSSWRRDWDGRRYHTREHLTRSQGPPDPGVYEWAVEHDSHCIGSARLRVDPGQHRATYSVGVFVAGLRGRGPGREITRLVLSWAFGVLGAHRVELEVLAGSSRAISCYRACGFRHEGIRREAELSPEGWKDFLHMGVLQAEYQSQPKTARTA